MPGEWPNEVEYLQLVIDFLHYGVVKCYVPVDQTSALIPSQRSPRQPFLPPLLSAAANNSPASGPGRNTPRQESHARDVNSSQAGGPPPCRGKTPHAAKRADSSTRHLPWYRVRAGHRWASARAEQPGDAA